MLPGETIASGAPRTCRNCLKHMEDEVLRSAAGYYIGTVWDCGPYSRESGYYRTEADAKAALQSGIYFLH
ncbi:MAG TPA: hypothetical protein VMU57_10715 [Edaphobacter sp.]|uniref:hypothetical protein n=1 Tax=Edaphobacter sp. TaxID=1934404 RepID=UPI002CB321EB|nr:hypothetical protein [Edaphobacter sp.]HUZ95375.1 hypothetical protein [Edaphobacter sp.]